MVTPSLVRMVSNGNHFKLQLVLEAAGPVNLEEGCFDKIKAAMPCQQPAIAADSNGQKKPQSPRQPPPIRTAGLDSIFYTISFAL